MTKFKTVAAYGMSTYQKEVITNALTVTICSHRCLSSCILFIALMFEVVFQSVSSARAAYPSCPPFLALCIVFNKN